MALADLTFEDLPRLRARNLNTSDTDVKKMFRAVPGQPLLDLKAPVLSGSQGLQAGRREGAEGYLAEALEGLEAARSWA